MSTTYSHQIIIYGTAELTLPNISGTLENVADIVIPPGLVIAYGGSGVTPPTGWLYCDGNAISRTTYSTLYNIIGTRYGTGDGTTTFNLPKMMSGSTYGIFPAGSASTENNGFDVDGVRTIQSNVTTQKIASKQMPSHTHDMNHFHNISSHGHTMPAHSHDYSHTHSIPSHRHSIASTTYYSTLGIANGGCSAGSGGTRFRYASTTETTVTLPASTSDNDNLGNATYTPTTEDNNSTSISDFTTVSQSTTTTGNSTDGYTGTTPSTQVDYVPNFTAFLWIIKT